MFKGWAILPAAQCLFGKTKVTMGEIAREWVSGTVVVCRKPNGQLHFIAGAGGHYADIGKMVHAYHDQTGAQFAGPWEVVNEVSYKTVDDQVQFQPLVPFNDELTANTKAAMAVFK
jgi:hypothetical protein